MCSILIFGGTTEGRELAELCAQNGIPAYVSVTTELGASLLGGVRVLTGPLTEAEMLELMTERRISLVFDATHPYAGEATENIRRACEAAGVRRLRVVRARGGKAGGCLYFDNMDGIAAYLGKRTGGVLITTGSKELAAFCRLKDRRERCAVRVLPSMADRCAELGFDRIITGMGPFTVEQNIEDLKKCSARFLVTKDSGPVGGMEEKLAAAKAVNAEVLILKRPEEDGISLSEAKRILIEVSEAHG